MTRRAGLLALVLVAGCGGTAPTAPSAPSAPAVVVQTPQPPPAPPVPAVWLISGQSNAVGCAVGTGPAPESAVTVNGAPAVDPLPFMEPYTGCQVGPWVVAAQGFAARTARPVQLAGWGRVASPISLWAASAEGWSRLRAAIPAGLDTFLWWQGESDAVADNHRYASDLADLVARVRAAAGSPSVRVVVIGLANTPYPDHESRYTRLRAAQAAFVASDPHAILVPAQGLPLNPAGPYHLTAAGYTELGHRIAAALAP